MTHTQPSAKSLSRALKLQETAQKLIVDGLEYTTVECPEGQKVVNWQLSRRKFAAREIKTVGDVMLAAHFARQALESLPGILATTDTSAAILAADEAHIALGSILKFSESATGKTPEALGLFKTYFPTVTH